jgi:hypothetical protein
MVFAPVKGCIGISKTDRDATLHLFTVPVCPCPGEGVNECGLAMIDMTHNSYIDTGNSYIMQMKSNLLTLLITIILIHNQSRRPSDKIYQVLSPPPVKKCRYCDFFYFGEIRDATGAIPGTLRG